MTLAAYLIVRGTNSVPISDEVAMVVGIMFAVLMVVALASGWAGRNDPRPILKRTKNPYRRYKQVGWKKRY